MGSEQGPLTVRGHRAWLDLEGHPPSLHRSVFGRQVLDLQDHLGVRGLGMEDFRLVENELVLADGEERKLVTGETQLETHTIAPEGHGSFEIRNSENDRAQPDSSKLRDADQVRSSHQRAAIA